jgi:hypothetical protein
LHARPVAARGKLWRQGATRSDKTEEAEEESKPRFSSAEISDAKNTIGAITRNAVFAFERESVAADGTTVAHALCKSATPVPAKPAALA